MEGGSPQTKQRRFARLDVIVWRWCRNGHFQTLTSFPSYASRIGADDIEFIAISGDAVNTGLLMPSPVSPVVGMTRARSSDIMHPALSG